MLEEKANLERATLTTKEDRLNYKEMYEIAAKEALEAIKAQKALEHIIAHMEVEQLPLKLKNVELANELKEKEVLGKWPSGTPPSH